MDTNKEFMRKVGLYVEQIVSKSMDDLRNSAYGSRQGELNDDNIDRADTKPDCGNSNQSETSVEQFAERLVDDCYSESLQELNKLCKMKPILCVGIVTLDLVTICEEFPEEDSKTIAVGHYWSRGGNAANTATVLAHLGAPVEYFGTMVRNQWTEFLQGDFKSNGVCIDNCIYLDPDKHKTPIATLLLSEKKGTRCAIADFKGITGPTYEQFSALNLGNYSWIHIEARSFEGRPKEIEDIIGLIKAYNQTHKETIVISIEMEQLHSASPELFTLFAKADIVLTGKEYAMDHGYTNKEDAMRGLYKHCRPGATLVCAWGSDGAAVMFEDQLVCSPAYPPEKLVDTLGAGDTFNAGCIYALSRGKSTSKASEFGCMVAGHKCGHRGFECVKCMQTKL